MKVRYPHECPFCHVMLVMGEQAERFRGLQWHPKCVKDYQKARAERQGEDQQ